MKTILYYLVQWNDTVSNKKCKYTYNDDRYGIKVQFRIGSKSKQRCSSDDQSDQTFG